MRLIDADILRDRINALEMLSTFKDSPSWPTYVYRTNEIDDVLDETPVVMQWHKPSEELPKNHRPILFTTKELDSGILIHGCLDDDNRFRAYFTHETWTEEQVTAWCYAPSLPDWCEEEENG